MTDRILHQINHFPEQMTAGDVVVPANMLSFGEYETPEQAVRDIVRWYLDRDTVKVEPCPHGNYAPHPVRLADRFDGWNRNASWTECDGKPGAE